MSEAHTVPKSHAMILSGNRSNVGCVSIMQHSKLHHVCHNPLSLCDTACALAAEDVDPELLRGKRLDEWEDGVVDAGKELQEIPVSEAHTVPKSHAMILSGNRSNVGCVSIMQHSKLHHVCHNPLSLCDTACALAAEDVDPELLRGKRLDEWEDGVVDAGKELQENPVSEAQAVPVRH